MYVRRTAPSQSLFIALVLAVALPACNNANIDWHTLSSGGTQNSKTNNCPNTLGTWTGSSTSGLEAIDESFFGNSGTLASISLTAGKIGTAFGLNGATSSVNIAASTNLNLSNSFSISSWVQSSSTSYNGNSSQSIVSSWGYNPNGLAGSSAWRDVDISGASILNNTNTVGYRGGVFDGRYVYMAPSQNGYAVAFDTQESLSSSSSWSYVNLAGSAFFNNANYEQFSNVVFDGRYVYYLPATYGYVAQYDTHGSFTSYSSWKGFNAGSSLGSAYLAITGGGFDGRYVYMIATGYIARYDTTLSFTSSPSWNTAYVAGSTILNSTSYSYLSSMTFDGRYAYFVSAYTNGPLAVYDTQGSFSSGSSWTGILIGGTSALNNSNYAHYSTEYFDGRYIYFSGSQSTGYTARYDTQAALTSPSSWQGVSVSSYLGGSYDNFDGVISDGRYLYFIPATSFSSYMARYDLQGAFSSSSSWSGISVQGSTAANNSYAEGFFGGTFDGRYLYFVPYNNTVETYDGNVVQYDTVASQASYNLSYSATNTAGGAASSPQNTTFTLQTEQGPLTVLSNTQLAALTWQHIVVTYDGSTLSLYLNGVLAATQTNSHPTGSGALIVNGGNGISIGSLAGGNSFFSGQIDDVQLYSVALTSTQVQTLYSSSSLGCY